VVVGAVREAGRLADFPFACSAYVAGMFAVLCFLCVLCVLVCWFITSLQMCLLSWACGRQVQV